MNILQAIINCPEKQILITTKQGARLRALCSPAEWKTYADAAANSGRGVIAVINKARILETDARQPTFHEGNHE